MFLAKERLKNAAYYQVEPSFLAKLVNPSIVYDRFQKPMANRSFIGRRPVKPIIPKIMNG